MGILDRVGEFIRNNDTVQSVVTPVLDHMDEKVEKFIDRGDAVFGTGRYEHASGGERLGGILNPKGRREAADDVESAEPEPGDVLVVSRGAYEHFGIYTAPDTVVHYTRPKGRRGKLSICETELDFFLQGAVRYQILEFPTSHGTPRRKAAKPLTSMIPGYDPADVVKLVRRVRYRLYSPEETITRAESRLGEDKYNLALNNCEHFAIWCKTGISESRQAEALIELTRPRAISIWRPD